MTPIERAARALVDNYPLDSGESPLDWQEAVPIVRAVLTAIREPSEAMLKAAEVVDFIGPGENDQAGEWQAMIDALLAEGA